MRSALIIVSIVIIIALIAYVALSPKKTNGITGDQAAHPATRLFDSKVIAAAETRMWQAYYGGNATALKSELNTIFREQFALSEADATAIGNDLGDAAMTFLSLRKNYEQALPPLERAYDRLKRATKGAWDSKAAARAELDWWVARRTPAQSSPENVGAKIADLYTILYGRSNADIERAGLLRAKAASIRDLDQLVSGNVDWQSVQHGLEESYAALVRGISQTHRF